MRTANEIQVAVTADLAVATTTTARALILLGVLHEISQNLCQPGFQPRELLHYLMAEQDRWTHD